MTPRELSELFAAERAVRPPEDLAQRGLTRLGEYLAAPAALPAVAGAKLGWVGVSKWVLGGLALGVVGSGVATTLIQGRQDSARAAIEARRPAVLARAGSELSAAPAPSLLEVEAQVEPPAAQPSVRLFAGPRAASSAPAAPALPPPRETFDAELRLINAAKAQLDAGRPHLVRVWLDEHAARYPNGVFATDCEGLNVLSRCAEQRDPRLAERFAAKHPTSPLLARLSRACETTNSK